MSKGSLDCPLDFSRDVNADQDVAAAFGEGVTESCFLPGVFGNAIAGRKGEEASYQRSVECSSLEVRQHVL